MSDLKAMNGFADGVDGLKVHHSEDQLVIGLDFGTTFSGIAYAFANSSKTEVISVMDWPGCEKQPKVDTLISYDPENPTEFTWGRQKHKGDVIVGLKLLLDPSQKIPLYLPAADIKADIKALGGREAVDVAADYIGALYKHAMAKLEAKIPMEYLLTCQKQYVLTVPAVWSDKARNTTLQAAKNAGIYPIEVIKEPQAAALYTLYMMEERSLGIGDAFVLCDAGGGTVDLISYEISKLSPNLELKELVPSKGGMAGSLGLNKRFAEEVKGLVGEDQWYELRKTHGFEQAARHFNDSIKVQFRGDLTEEYDVNFPRVKLKDDPENNLETNCWTMKGEIVARIFAPFIDDIQRFVGDQVNLIKAKRAIEHHPKAEEIKAIFLVGGFGSSEYLKIELQKCFPDIQIIQPHDAWAAIVKGAVLSKIPHQALVVSFKAQRHYGVSANEEYNEILDKGQQRIPDASDGKDKVLKMTWYVHQGEDLKKEHKVRFPFFRSLRENYTDEDLVFKDELMQCDSKIAAKYPNATTKVNVVLTADLRKVDRKLFRKRTGIDGKTYHDVFYELIVNIQPAIMKFSMEIGGKELGSVDASYD